VSWRDLSGRLLNRWTTPVTAIIAALLLSTAAPALANGAMSLALSTFAWPLWLVYVAVTVVFEAAAFSRWLHIPIFRALRISCFANTVTALGGGILSGLIGYGFYGIFGSRLNPNPFGQTVFLFTLFGLGSALIEAGIWHESASKKPPTTAARKTVGASLAIHLAATFIGLVILLSPTRPYGGLEGQAWYHRTWDIERKVSRLLTDYFAERGEMPKVRSYQELLATLQPRLKGYERERDLWAAAFVPEYGRFDTGQSRSRQTWEWNPAATRLRYSDVKSQPTWLARVRLRGGIRAQDWCEGLVVDPGGYVHRTTGCSNLGYPF
jgi:hypothetical protein